MLVRSVKAEPVRSLACYELELAPGMTAVTGPNGAGKTNLLESLYFALTGRSFRANDRRELVPHGGSLARAEATVVDDQGTEYEFLAAVTRAEGRRHLLGGEPVDPRTAGRYRPHIAVFAPDRLSLIKGAPAERRAHLDAFMAARRPSLGELRRGYGQALAQRNAMLGRVAAGQAGPAELDAWDGAMAAAAAPLIAARAEATGSLAGEFTGLAAELGLPGRAELSYAPRAEGDAAEIAAGLAERRDADLRNGRGTWGPHLDEVRIELAGRSLRRYGSQGQQRAALLALLFAEREELAAAHAATPILLLDDVMSELDPPHRDLLGERLAAGGQSLITAADSGALPGAAIGVQVEMGGG